MGSSDPHALFIMILSDFEVFGESCALAAPIAKNGRHASCEVFAVT